MRSTRWGLSAGIDAHGRLRGWRSDLDDDRKVLLVEVPGQGITTVYTVIGDAFIGALALLVAVAYLIAVRRASMFGRPYTRARCVDATPTTA